MGISYFLCIYVPLELALENEIFSKNCKKSNFARLGTQRVFLFLDRKTKEPTGDATITFQSAETAQKAIDTFDETDFNGHGLIQNRHPRAEESFRRDVGEFYLFSHIYFK